MKRFLAAILSIILLAAFCIQGVAEGEDNKVRIFIAGDSTAQSYGARFAPQGGWGQFLHLFFNDSVEIVNRAIAGRSLKSFFNDGRLTSILEEAAAGDYLIIQFGHNDGASNKPERYATEAEFDYLLRQEYIAAAQKKGINVILATQTTSRWFGADGVIGDTSNVYTRVTRAVAAELKLPLLEVNTVTREIANALGVEGSKKAYLWNGSTEDNTHFSYYGATLVADAVANEIKNNVPALASAVVNGYRMVKLCPSGVATEFDVSHLERGFEHFAVSASGAGMVRINGKVYLTEDCDDARFCATVADESGKIIVTTLNGVNVEVSPVWEGGAEGGFDTASVPLTLYMPSDTYDFTFEKSDTERGSISVNSQQVGSNVDMYGTVGIPSGAVHKFSGFRVTGGKAQIRVGGRTTRLKKASAYLTSSVLPAKRKIFVAGDSTLCNYYPVYPDDENVKPGTRQTGWAQLLERFVTTDGEVVNLASSGDWARDWRDVVFPTVEQNAAAGDYLIIQFGINDRNRDDKKIATMTDALRDMVKRAEAIGVIPVLVRPQPSVGYSWGNAGENEKPNGNNGGFFNAVSDTAKELGVCYIDLFDIAAEHFASVGRDYVARNYHLWDYEKNELRDKLHISYVGAKKLCSFVCSSIARQKDSESRFADFPLNSNCTMREILYTKNSLRLWNEVNSKVRIDNSGAVEQSVTLIRCSYSGSELKNCETVTLTVAAHSSIYLNQNCMVML